MHRRVFFVEIGVPGLYGELSAVRHRIAGIDCDIEQRVL
jgi:hypothetical protein